MKKKKSENRIKENKTNFCNLLCEFYKMKTFTWSYSEYSVIEFVRILLGTFLETLQSLQTLN